MAYYWFGSGSVSFKEDAFQGKLLHSKNQVLPLFDLIFKTCIDFPMGQTVPN